MNHFKLSAKHITINLLIMSALIISPVMIISCTDNQHEQHNGHQDEYRGDGYTTDEENDEDMDDDDMSDEKPHKHMDDGHMTDEEHHEHTGDDDGVEAEAGLYKCPMNCEDGKTYEKAGKCPVCKMDLTRDDK